MSESNLPANSGPAPRQKPEANKQPVEQPDERPFDRAKQVNHISLFVGERKEWNPEEEFSPPPVTADAKSLTPHQIRTLQLLANGVSITDAALDTGVSRNTIYRWLRCHPTMRAMHERWKQVCHDSAQSRLIALQDTAVEVLAEQLETKRNPRVAAMLLDKMGAMRPPEIKATTPTAAQREIELERRQRNIQLAERTKRTRRDEDSIYDEDKLVDDSPAGS